MDRLIVILSIVALSVIGVARIVVQLRSLGKKLEFVHEYLEKLKAYVEGHGADREAYGWMIHRSNKMQNQLGTGGIMAAYRPPFANYQYTNYPILLNMLPELRRAYEDSLLSNNLAHQYATTIQEVLIRHAGTLEDRREAHLNQLRNPLIWFREGVRAVIAFPLSVLSWAGVLSVRAVGAITQSATFNVISGLVGLLTLLSAIMSIALGWQEFVKLVNAWWPKVF